MFPTPQLIIKLYILKCIRRLRVYSKALDFNKRNTRLTAKKTGPLVSEIKRNMVTVAVHSKLAILLLFIHCLFIAPICVGSLFWCGS